jgi:hypothetical protein
LRELLDDQLRHKDDQPSIGIILCPGRNAIIVDYALRDTSKPMGVARYTHSPALPLELQRSLPTAEQFAGEYAAMSLVKLRIDIERTLRTVIAANDLPVDSPMRIDVVLAELKTRGLAPPTTDRFRDALRIINQAAHGVALEGSVVADAVKVGRTFLAELLAMS